MRKVLLFTRLSRAERISSFCQAPIPFGPRKTAHVRLSSSASSRASCQGSPGMRCHLSRNGSIPSSLSLWARYSTAGLSAVAWLRKTSYRGLMDWVLDIQESTARSNFPAAKRFETAAERFERSVADCERIAECFESVLECSARPAESSQGAVERSEGPADRFTGPLERSEGPAESSAGSMDDSARLEKRSVEAARRSTTSSRRSTTLLDLSAGVLECSSGPMEHSAALPEQSGTAVERSRSAAERSASPPLSSPHSNCWGSTSITSAEAVLFVSFTASLIIL